MSDLGELLSSSSSNKRPTAEERVSLPFSRIRSIGSVPQLWKSTVRTLLLASNEIVHLDGLRQFRFLNKLSLANNRILSLDELRHIPESVETLTLEGNPVDVVPDYRQSVIILLPNLKMLDNKGVTEQERCDSQHDKIVSGCVLPFLFRRKWDVWMLKHLLRTADLHHEMLARGVVCEVPDALVSHIRKSSRIPTSGVAADGSIVSVEHVFPFLAQLPLSHLRTSIQYFESKRDCALNPKELTSVIDSFPNSVFFFDEFKGSDADFSAKHPSAHFFFPAFAVLHKTLESSFSAATAESRASIRSDAIREVFLEITEYGKRIELVLSDYVRKWESSRVFLRLARQSGVVDAGLGTLLREKSQVLSSVVAENNGLKKLLVAGASAPQRKAATTVAFEDALTVARSKYAAELVGIRAKRKFSAETQTSVKRFYARRMRSILSVALRTWTMASSAVRMDRLRIERKGFNFLRIGIAMQKEEDTENIKQFWRTADKKHVSQLFLRWRRASRLRKRRIAMLERDHIRHVKIVAFERWKNAFKWTKRMKDVLGRAAEKQAQKVIDSLTNALPPVAGQPGPQVHCSSPTSLRPRSSGSAVSTSKIPSRPSSRDITPVRSRSPAAAVLDVSAVLPPKPFTAQSPASENNIERMVLKEWDDYCDDLGMRLTRTVSERIMSSPSKLLKKKKTPTPERSASAKDMKRSPAKPLLAKKSSSSLTSKKSLSKLVVVRK
eukprot:ANDGO_02489.mRNA.1 hypothetical protein